MAHSPARSSIRNPLAHDPDREQRVRERAYHLWEADGKPHGRDVEYWERARELVGMEESAGSGQLPNPQSNPNSPRETGIEEADIQANLGEFPGRMTDQGEAQTTPAPVKAAPARVKAAAAPHEATPAPAKAAPAPKRRARPKPKKPA
ncbi:MAG TPA: DUF2934 domain-containing protein [Rhodopila sp.]